MSAFGLILFIRPNENYRLCILQYVEVKQILVLLMIARLCHKRIHLPSLCAFYGNVLKKYFLIKDDAADEHTENRISSEHPICN